MKKLHWILIALALVAIVVLTMPKDFTAFTDTTCQHTYEYSNHCSVKICTKCGNTQNNVSHSYVRTDCSHIVCSRCGDSVTGHYHTFTKAPCSSYNVCSVCNYTENTNIEKHTWVTDDNCESGHFYCKDCGSTDHPYSSFNHQYQYSLFLFFGFCTRCGHVTFQIPTFRYVAAFIGLLLTIAAFIYIFVNRKSITVQGGKYIRTATPNAYVREGEAERHPF